MAALRAHVRSRTWITRFGLAVALGAWYGHWVVWVALALARQQDGTVLHHAARLAGDPVALLKAVRHAAQHDAWTVGTVPMLAAWATEATILLLCATGRARARTELPYCDASKSWAEKIELSVPCACVGDPAAAARSLEQAPHRLPHVLAPMTAPEGAEHALVTLYRCRGGDTFVSVVNCYVAAGLEGKHAFIEQPWLTALRVPGIDAATLQAQLEARADGSAVALPDDDAAVPPELASALAMFQAAQFGDAFARALPHVQSAQRQLRCDANRLCALARMREKRWPDAIAYWRTLFAEEMTPGNAMQLAGCHAMAGDLPAGGDWFARARVLNAASHALPPLTLLTTYVSALDMAGHPVSAMPWLDEIRETYCAYRRTDPAALSAQRMPLFGEFLDRSAPIVVAALGRDAGLRWFAGMLGRMDEAGNVELGQWLDEQARSLAGDTSG